MEIDGVSLSIGSAALASICGVLGALIKARYQRTEITPQPLEVKAAARFVSCEDCAAHRRQHEDDFKELREDNSKDHENLFCRLGTIEKANAAASARLDQINHQLDSMDGKLDRIIANGCAQRPTWSQPWTMPAQPVVTAEAKK